MKKRFAGIAALGMALTLAFGMTVSAAGSITTSQGTQTDLNEAFKEIAVEENVTVGGESIKLETSPVLVEKQDAVEKLVESGTVAGDVAKALEEANGGTVEVKVDHVLPGVTVTAPNVSAKALEAGVPVKISQVGIIPGMTYIVAHMDDKGNVEYLGPVEADGNSITVLFHHFSTAVPIQVTIDEKDDDDADNSSAGNNSAATTTASGKPASPKTGEVLPIAGFMAVVCLAGAVVCVRKARN